MNVVTSDGPPSKKLTITKSKEVEVSVIPVMAHRDIAQLVNAIVKQVKQEAFASDTYRHHHLFAWCRRTFVNVREDILWMASSMAIEVMSMTADKLLNESVKLMMDPNKGQVHPLTLPYDLITKMQSLNHQD